MDDRNNTLHCSIAHGTKINKSCDVLSQSARDL